MWSPSLFYTFNRFYRTQNSVGLLNEHIIVEFPWLVIMEPAVPSTDIFYDDL